MKPSALALAAALACSPVLLRPAEADACSFPPPIYLEEDLSEPLTGIPTSGVVPLYVQARPDEVLPDDPLMTVYDADDAPVSGAVELTESRLVWRADAPLQPDSTYEAVLALGYGGEIRFSFTTGADATVPAPGLEAGDMHLREVARAAERICCDPLVNSCGTEEYEHCWVQAVDHLPVLQVKLETAPAAARYYRFERDAPGATSAYVSQRGDLASATFPERRTEYCLTVRALSLVDDTAVQGTACQADAALETLPPFVPEQPDYDQCEEPPVDPDTKEPVDVGSSGGCSTADSSALANAWPIALLCLLGLGLARRRTRRPMR